jgi:hypothetical protein
MYGRIRSHSQYCDSVTFLLIHSQTNILNIELTPSRREFGPTLILVCSIGIDPAVVNNEPPVTNLAIIGLVVVAVILVLILVDLICFCVNRAGILAFICDRNKSKHHEEDPKLGREEREPLKPDGMNGERNMSVEFDGKHVYSKSGEIIGKHSAV